MPDPDEVTCPKCGSTIAVIAYRLESGEEGKFCRDCEHAWNTRPGPAGKAPIVGDPPVTNVDPV